MKSNDENQNFVYEVIGLVLCPDWVFDNFSKLLENVNNILDACPHEKISPLKSESVFLDVTEVAYSLNYVVHC